MRYYVYDNWFWCLKHIPHKAVGNTPVLTKAEVRKIEKDSDCAVECVVCFNDSETNRNNPE